MRTLYAIHLLDEDSSRNYVTLTHNKYMNVFVRSATLFTLDELTDDRLLEFLNNRPYELKQLNHRRDLERL